MYADDARPPASAHRSTRARPRVGREARPRARSAVVVLVALAGFIVSTAATAEAGPRLRPGSSGPVNLQEGPSAPDADAALKVSGPAETSDIEIERSRQLALRWVMFEPNDEPRAVQADPAVPGAA